MAAGFRIDTTIQDMKDATFEHNEIEAERKRNLLQV